MTGKNVLDIIAHVVIIDIKAKLKSTDMTIQEIAYSLNFPSASFFGKYFKRHMGMSPLEYRKQLTYPPISVTQESTMAIAASMGVNSIPYTG